MPPRVDPRLRRPQEGRRPRQPRPGKLPRRQGGRDRPGRRRGHRRQARRPLPAAVWQTGSGTQTNMNANEVIANRAIELQGGELGNKKPVHPNDDVNMSPVVQRHLPDGDAHRGRGGDPYRLIPAVRKLRDALAARRRSSRSIVKIGRTHLQDAVPLTLGQEFSGYVAPARPRPRAHRGDAAAPVRAGPGRHGRRHRPERPRGVRRRSPREIAELTGLPFVSAPNKFEALAAHDAIVVAHGALKTLAAALMKIANDVRWLASGPRSGLGELTHPRERAGLVDHAGQGEPDAVRGDDDGVRAGDRQRRRHRPSPAPRATSS